ncbi:retrovirus-related pol polyprotein from transposon TNT 1-94 [Tanacetum coccineum]
MGKSKKKPHKPKFEDTNQEKLYLLHMDLCGPMRIASVNGKKYILIIVDDYSRFAWVKFLRSKDEAPYFIIKFLKMIQKVGISHETSIARSPWQNGVIERRNRTLIEVARTMLIYAKAPLFLWAEVVATAYFDELTGMASEHNSSGPALHEMTPATNSSRLVPNPPPSTPVDYPALKVITPIAEVVAPEPDASTSLPSSTTVDQDAPSPNVIPTIMHTAAPYSEHVTKCTKDNPLDNIIGELERPVSIRIQLHVQALFCYYDAFLISVKPKNYKDALTQACWIEAIQEELNLKVLKSGNSFLVQIK